MLFGIKGNRGSIKDINGSEGLVLSYPSTFGVEDAGGDIVERGAFKRTITAWGPLGKNRIKPLYQHDPAWMVGKVMRLEEDSFGLLAETKFSDTAMGRDTLTLIKDGALTEQSIGYDIILADGDDNMKRHLRELKLYEYSFVTWGMNEVTPIIGVKTAAERAELKSRIERFEKALRDSKFDSEEVPHMVQIAVAQWKDALVALGDQEIIVHDMDTWLAWLAGEDGEKANRLITEIKEGRVLSTGNRSIIESALEALQALLDAADSSKGTQPPKDPPGPSPSNSDLAVKELRELASMAGLRSAEVQLRDFAASLRKE